MRGPFCHGLCFNKQAFECPYHGTPPPSSESPCTTCSLIELLRYLASLWPDDCQLVKVNDATVLSSFYISPNECGIVFISRERKRSTLRVPSVAQVAFQLNNVYCCLINRDRLYKKASIAQCVCMCVCECTVCAVKETLQ